MSTRNKNKYIYLNSLKFHVKLGDYPKFLKNVDKTNLVNTGKSRVYFSSLLRAVSAVCKAWLSDYIIGLQFLVHASQSNGY